MSRNRRRLRVVAAIATGCVVIGGCSLESPVSVTDRPLAEQLEDRRVSVVDEASAEPQEIASSAPQSLAFAEALATGGLVRLHVTDEGVPLSLRSGPGAGYDILADVPSGAEVLATGNRTGEWVHVMYADFDGWVPLRRVTFDEVDDDQQLVDASLVERTPVTYVVVGEAIGVNIRREPDATSELVSGAPAGSLVTGSGNTSDAWVEVTYQGVTGWASGNYLELLDADAVATSTSTTVAVTLNTDE